MKVLVIIEEFGDYVRGFVVREAKEIEAILSGHNAGKAVVADHPAEAKPDKD